MTLWRRRRWRFLLNLIDGLPRNSAYGEALAQDEQLAEQALASPAPPGSGAVRVSEYTPEFEMLINVFDRLGDLIQATVAAQGGKPPKIKPYPRPATALDRVKERRRYVKHRQLVARVLPPQADPEPLPAPAAEPPPVLRAAPAILPGEDPFRFIPGR